jgi:lysozyme
MPTTDTIDISHWNGAPDFQKLAQAGIKNVWIKCTNGAFQTDDQYARNVSQAHQAGINVGSYAFLLSSQDPDQQAEKFVNSLNRVGMKQDLLPALDCEWDIRAGHDRWADVGGNVAPSKKALVRAAMIGRFVAHIEKYLGVNPIIYTATSWWRSMIGEVKQYGETVFGDCPLWIADYRQVQTPPLPSQWSKHSIWQFTGKGQMAGIVGNVDLDSLNVEIESLKMSQKAISA